MATTNTWYKAGTVATTAASKIVTGVGTTWSLHVNIGDIFTIDGHTLYEVASIQSDTQLTLAKDYPTTAATQSYAIIRNFTGTIPSELAAKLATMQERWYKSLGDYTNLVTSTAATVTITKTDGTTVTVPTFAAMVDASKAPAKVHADAAAASAATATTKATEAAASATSAAQAVIDAAVPFPDVWIPFNDDLSMLAGRNDGTKTIKINDVDSTIVDGKTVSFSRASTKTYTDKSGVLRTAAIDEPCFEKEGLLIEWQSTNLVPFSNDGSKWQVIMANSYAVTQVGSAYKIVPSANILATTGAVGISPSNTFPEGATPLSYTIEAKADGFDMISIGVRGSYLNATDNGIGVSLIDGTVKKTNQGFVLTGFEKLQDGFVKISVSTSSYTSATASWRMFVVGCGSMSQAYKAYTPADADGVKGIIIRNAQLELSPLPTSHIPTNGAAATRAADKVWIKTENNKCVNWFNGGALITPVEVGSNLEFPAAKLRNVRGWMAVLTNAQKGALK